MTRGRCEASGSGRGVGDGAAGLEQCDYVSPSATSQREFSYENIAPVASRYSAQGETNKKSRRSRGCNPQPVCGMESSRSDACNQSEGKYTLLRDAIPSQSDEFHTPHFAR